MSELEKFLEELGEGPYTAHPVPGDPYNYEIRNRHGEPVVYTKRSEAEPVSA